MDEIRWFVPTYNASRYPEAVERGGCAEYGSPEVPVLIRQEAGIRILLGTHEAENGDAPDVLIERQPGGWLLILHPAGGDPSGLVYLLDDGRTFAQPDARWGAPTQIQMLEPFEPVPVFDADR